MQFRLRTLLIVLAVGPILAAWGYREVDEYLRDRRMGEELIKICNPPWRSLKVRSARPGLDEDGQRSPLDPP
jgi:hypothetical protein